MGSIKCLHQIFKPDNVTSIPVEGMGNCQICKTDDNNKNCKKFFPITELQEFSVEKKEKD
jgi:hypothetical protein